jgi:hypothetical protein
MAKEDGQSLQIGTIKDDVLQKAYLDPTFPRKLIPTLAEIAGDVDAQVKKIRGGKLDTSVFSPEEIRMFEEACLLEDPRYAAIRKKGEEMRARQAALNEPPVCDASITPEELAMAQSELEMRKALGTHTATLANYFLRII